MWHSGKILQNLHGLNDIFPFKIPTGKPSASRLLNNFAKVVAWNDELRRASVEHQPHGYRLEMMEINHRSLGKQSVPQSVVFEDAVDLITFIKKQKEAEYFQQQLDNINNQLPQLSNWCIQNPLKVIEYREF